MHTDRFLDVDTHLADVQEALHGTDPKWMAIGIQLRIPNAKLSKIRAEPHSNLEDCNRQMQITWLKTGKATWADLVKALRTKTVGLPEVADSIEKMHIHHDKNANHQTGMYVTVCLSLPLVCQSFAHHCSTVAIYVLIDFQ